MQQTAVQNEALAAISRIPRSGRRDVASEDAKPKAASLSSVDEPAFQINELSEGVGEQTIGMRVVVRARPQHKDEDNSCAQCQPDGATIAIEAKRGDGFHPHTFHAVFGPSCSQDDIFQDSGLTNLIDRAIQGYTCTTFAFGQTGSGKTHTITGPAASADGGLVLRAINYLFLRAAETPQTTFAFRVTFFEIYNEQVLDLLNSRGRRGVLAVRWRQQRGFYVENLHEVDCASPSDMLQCLEVGLRERAIASHDMNERSSRSHTMLTIYIDATTADDDIGSGARTTGKLCIVDLAGSERVQKTKSEGSMLVESSNINKSLLALGNCISLLADNKRKASAGAHIPYRDSVLTMLLKDSLGGSGMTLMIACVSPDYSSASETLNTLRYASRAKRIENKPLLTEDPHQKLVSNLRREIEFLRLQNHRDNDDVDADMPRELLQMRLLLQQCLHDNEILRQTNAALVGQLSDTRYHHTVSSPPVHQQRSQPLFIPLEAGLVQHSERPPGKNLEKTRVQFVGPSVASLPSIKVVALGSRQLRSVPSYAGAASRRPPLGLDVNLPIRPASDPAVHRQLRGGAVILVPLKESVATKLPQRLADPGADLSAFNAELRSELNQLDEALRQQSNMKATRDDANVSPSLKRAVKR